MPVITALLMGNSLSLILNCVLFYANLIT